MFDVLDRPEHRVSNWAFICLNVVGILLSLAGAGVALVSIVAARTQGDGIVLAIGFGVGLASILFRMLFMGFAQCIRYLAVIASKP